MPVRETDVPGVGRKFELDLSGGASVVAVLHHDGRCEIYRRDGPDADAEKLLDLNGDTANKLGSIMEGAYFESVDLDDLSVPLGDAIIEWVDVPDDSSVVGQTLQEANVREETGASVIAVQRGPDTVPNPGPDAEIAAGDILVSVGTRGQVRELRRLVETEA